MHPLQNGTQVPDMPDAPNPIGDAGYMTEEGSPSVPGAHYFNAQIKEFQNALVAAGVTFDRTKFDHLAKAITEPNKNLIKSLTGMVVPFHTTQSISGWLDLKGGTASRTVDATLWEYAQASGLVVSQATKDADPMTYAMYFGDGDGADTFTLPNHHLGHFTRGNPSGVAHGETQGDAIRNIVGKLDATNKGEFLFPEEPNIIEQSGALKASGAQTYSNGAGSGANTGTAVIEFNAAGSVPTDDENRPYTANLSIKIHRGWMQ